MTTAKALAHPAIRAGAEARFRKTSRALANLAGGRADRTWDKRLAELARPAVLVLDDFGMRELPPSQADDLCELITEQAGKSIILTSHRAPADWYPLFPTRSSPSRCWTASSTTATSAPERAELPLGQEPRACRPHREHERKVE